MNRKVGLGLKKTVSLVLACALVLTSVATSSMAAGTAQTQKAGSFYSTSNPPKFDGTTDIKLPLNAAFDPQNTRYRLTASDFEDGDVSAAIQIISNNVDTSRAGSYQVAYKITDSHGNSAQKEVAVQVGVQTEVIQRTLYTLASVKYMDMAGTHRGNYHDRQNLGVYMPAGSTVRVRQTNPAFGKALECGLYTDDSEKEKNTGNQKAYYSIPADGSWVTLTSTFDSVPFIKTPYEASSQPVLEIEWNANVKTLDYYRQGDNQQTFFTAWDKSQNAYAVLENERATILVPRKDRNLLLRNGNTAQYYRFDTLDELLQYYLDFLAQYDRFLGVELDPDDPVNQNVRTKFFIKADAHGIGAAYYSSDYTATNSDSADGYYEKTWLNLHEFGHGYEGSLARQELNLVEILNNVFAYYYQQTFLSADDGGWLGFKRDIEKRMKSFRDSGEDYNTSGKFSERLYSLVNLLDKIGPEEAMAYLERQYRGEVAAGRQPGAADSFCRAFGEYSGYNVIPYFDSWGVEPSASMKAQIYENNGKMVYYLRDLVASDQKAEELRGKLGLNGLYDLVDNDDIQGEGMKGSAQIKIQIDDLAQISGKNIVIKDGTEIIREVPVTGKTLTIADLPVGIYTLQLPNTKTEPYQFDYQYLVVSQNANAVKEVAYTKLSEPALASDSKIQLQGLSNWIFSETSLDLNGGTMTVKTSEGQPHYYFSSIYASIEVLNTKGERVYFKNYNGSDSYPGAVDTFAIDEGYQVKIHHEEPSSRLVFVSQCLNQRESDYIVPNNQGVNKDTVYTITPYGYQKSGWDTQKMVGIYQAKLDQWILNVKTHLSSAQMANKNLYPGEKNKILSSIYGLPEADRAAYLAANQLLFSGSAPVLSGADSRVLYVGGDFAPFTYLTAADVEDGAYALSASNTKIVTDVPSGADGKLSAKGSYQIQYTVTDIDGNTAEKTVSVTVVDQTALALLVEKAQKINLENYEESGKAAFTAALTGAQALLKNGSTQAQADAAEQALQKAMNALVELQKPDKSTLKLVLELAQAYVDSGETDALIPVAKAQFDKVFKRANEVYTTNSAQAEIDKAWKDLMLVIQAMNFVPGDKTELIALVAAAGALDLTAYQDGKTKEAFRAALKDAQEMLADPNAMAADILSVYDALADARDSLIPVSVTGDKTELGKVLEIANSYDLNQYVEDAQAKADFLKARKAASDIFNKSEAAQDEIDEARTNLLTAMAALRLRADKASLNEWIEKLKAYDLSKYTAESAQAVRSAIVRAEALAAQDLSVEEIDLILAQITEMILAEEGLKLKPENPGESSSTSGESSEKPDGGNSSEPNVGSSSANNTSGASSGGEADEAPGTGDSVPVAALSILAVAAVGALLLIKKRRA